MQRVNKYPYLIIKVNLVVTMNIISIIKIAKERNTIFKVAKKRKINITN